MIKAVSATFLTVLLLGPVARIVRPQTSQTTPSQAPADAPQTSSAPATQPRIETQISKSIVFISAIAKWPDKDGQPGKRDDFGGTGFLVSVGDSRLGKDPNGNDSRFSYLVTNRHVALGIETNADGTCSARQILQMFVVMNLKDPVNGRRSTVVPLPQPTHWYFPEDPAIDLAAIPLGTPDALDVLTVGVETFLLPEVIKKQQVVPGDKVLTGGFYNGFPGLHEIQPILRQGVLAMMPDGPMTTTVCGQGTVYLADIHIIPGNSGSPLFVMPSLQIGVPMTFGLLGVVSGYMIEKEDATLTATTTWTGSVNANSGIAMVVPAEQLKVLLDGPELKQLREQWIQRTSSTQPRANPNATH
jgi:hypothetical protein